MTDRPAIPVLYVAGAGRSGSTLLEQLICDRGGYFGLGELSYIWQRGCRFNERCSCGRPFHDCPFWTDVLDDTFGGLSAVPVDRLIDSQRFALRMRNIPLFRFPALRSAELRGHVQFLQDAYARLYQAVARRSGASVLVDSTKTPVFGHLLADAPDIDLRVMHLVRDSRAVAHSWQRRRRRPEANEQNQFMPVFDARTSARIWVEDNTFAGGLRRHVQQGFLLRYEDLAARPSLVADALRDLGLPVTSSREVEEEGRHSVSGNPSRMSPTNAAVAVDTAWMSEMTPADRRVVTGLTAPGLVRYGYPVRLRTRAGRDPAGH